MNTSYTYSHLKVPENLSHFINAFYHEILFCSCKKKKNHPKQINNTETIKCVSSSETSLGNMNCQLCEILTVNRYTWCDGKFFVLTWLGYGTWLCS